MTDSFVWHPERRLARHGATDEEDWHTQLRNVTKNDNLLVMRVIAETVTAKAQYPVRDLAEVEMPSLDWA